MIYTYVMRRAWPSALATILMSTIIAVAGAGIPVQVDKQPAGRSMLWSDPGNVASRNVYWGSGSEAGAPQPPFQFVKEDKSGTNAKVHVTDAAGVRWNVKFDDEEVYAEVAASRIASALGYMVEETYFVPSGKIVGASGLGRAREFVAADGTFRHARFEKRPENITRQEIEWAWDENPFVGTRELSGLMILNALLNNFDTKKSNNTVLRLRGEDGSVIDWYVISDWGGTFGKGGGRISNSKWDLDDYRKSRFVKKVSGDRLELDYRGLAGSEHDSVPLEHARWFAGLLGQLSDEQLRDAFRAAGASEVEVEGFAQTLRARIGELQSAVGSAPSLARGRR